MNTITVITIVVVGIMSGYSVYLINRQKDKLTKLHGLVAAMAIGTLTGLMGGYLLGILTADLFLASGIGIIIGFMFGFLAGQPTGILPILNGSISGLMSGIIGGILGTSLNTQNPFIMLIVLLILYIIITGFVILFIKVETNPKLTLDTQAISPFIIISAGVVALSLFLFLYSSDIIKDTNSTTSTQQQNGTANASSSGIENTEVDVTKKQKPKVYMEVTQTGYTPNVIHVKQGVPVEIKIHNSLVDSCLSTLNMPDFNLNNVNLKVGTTTLHFTPTQKGEFTFSCSMNMYKGKIIVE